MVDGGGYSVCVTVDGVVVGNACVQVSKVVDGVGWW